MSDVFTIVPPTQKALPIVVSVPHCGTQFPDSLRSLFRKDWQDGPDDTDWFVHRLYDFAPEMGITLIYAHYSRYVIDLNRDPESRPLYDDGRVITELVPSRTFTDEPLYVDAPPSQAQIEERKNLYYWPYHHKVKELLSGLQEEFSQVLLWDAHSIRRMVPTIRSEPFPDLILGNQDGKTASPVLIETAFDVLSGAENYQLSHNEPFKGGYITRSFGAPEKGIHALQLEMAKDLYMDDTELHYSEERATQVRELLQKTFKALSEKLLSVSSG